MLSTTATSLERLVDQAAERLHALPADQTRVALDTGSWSSQQILGHLVDSAANNHQRFIRAQQEDPLVFPRYEQNDWVERQDYNAANWHDLIDLWRLYNLHLAHVIRRVPEDRLEVLCAIGPYEPVTLRFLIEDYLEHLKHHLKKIEEQSAS